MKRKAEAASASSATSAASADSAVAAVPKRPSVGWERCDSRRWFVCHPGDPAATHCYRCVRWFQATEEVRAEHWERTQMRKEANRSALWNWLPPPGALWK